MTRRAAPKSSSSGPPLPSSRMTLSGAMSRWNQLAAWITASASVSGASRPSSQRSSGGSAIARTVCLSVRPS